MAWERRRPAPGLIHHSDQGNHCRAGLYRIVLARRGVVLSMSRKGQLLRQCAGRELLQFAQERVGATSAVCQSGPNIFRKLPQLTASRRCSGAKCAYLNMV
jgi:hypothetical protein